MLRSIPSTIKNISCLRSRLAADKMLITEPFGGDKACQEVKDAISKLDLSLPGNITAQMSLDLEKVGLALKAYVEQTRTPVHSATDIEELLVGKRAAESVLQEWKRWMTTYGHRGDRELDLGSYSVFINC